MNPVHNAICCAKTKLCVAVVVIVVIIIILAISLSAHDEDTEEKLKFASKKLEFPTCYVITRPNTVNAFKEILYLTTEGRHISRAKRCILCKEVWTYYVLNKQDEIAVIVKKSSRVWGDTYEVEEMWLFNATSYKIEYDWSVSGESPEVYFIKNSHGDNIAYSNHFRLEVDNTIMLKNSKTNTLLGVIERPAFQFFPTWKVFVNNTDVLPTYLFGVLATVTTLKEVEDDDDD